MRHQARYQLNLLVNCLQCIMFSTDEYVCPHDMGILPKTETKNSTSTVLSHQILNYNTALSVNNYIACSCVVKQAMARYYIGRPCIVSPARQKAFLHVCVWSPINVVPSVLLCITKTMQECCHTALVAVESAESVIGHAFHSWLLIFIF